MSQQQGLTIPPQVEAALYFLGLIAVYLASYSPPIGAPDTVRTAFGLLGTAAIIIKYELATQPKPQITTHQALYSTLALILSVAGGQLSASYAAYWYGGLIMAVVGAVVASYEDLGGKIAVATIQA